MPDAEPDPARSVMRSSHQRDTGVLKPIVARKREEIVALAPIDPAALTRADRSLSAALRRPSGERVRVIAECKKASPSAGLLRPGYDPGALAREYRACGAAALSVLTDSKFFQGDITHLTAASAAGIPVLRKDFIIDEKQIFEARQHGADAILLIVRLLDESQLRDFSQTAAALGMDALVETHDAAEVEVALRARSRIIGINHRNLDDLTMNMGLSAELAPRIRAADPEAILVAESGVESREGWRQVDGLVDALLIGTAFMRSADIQATWREILG